MPTNFLSLPSELRNDIYEQVLGGSKHCIKLSSIRNPETRGPIPGLLLANKSISLEAASVLYAATCFDFDDSTSKSVVAFLDQIGRRNASFILDLRVDFPTFDDPYCERMALEEENEAVLAKIHDFCKSLRTITTVQRSTDAMIWQLVSVDYHVLYAIALGLVDERFRSVASLREVIVEVGEGVMTTVLWEKMMERGWKVVEIEEPFPEVSCSFDDVAYEGHGCELWKL